jgi:hypothetical protein
MLQHPTFNLLHQGTAKQKDSMTHSKKRLLVAMDTIDIVKNIG